MLALLKLFYATLAFFTTFVSGKPFLFSSAKNVRRIDSLSPYLTALSSGIFLGLALLHFLPEAHNEALTTAVHHYPFSYAIAGASFLLFLFMDKRHARGEEKAFIFIVIATLLLSIHSFFIGVALGAEVSIEILSLSLLPLLLHKWAVGAALSMRISKSPLSVRARKLLFLFFVFMLPSGIIVGEIYKHALDIHPLILSSLLSISSGVFLYLGIAQSMSALQNNPSLRYTIPIFTGLGFLLMALLAIGF